MTQCEKILAMIRKHPGITTWELQSELHLPCVTARISDLRNAGHKIINKKNGRVTAEGKSLTGYYVEEG